MAHVTIYTSPFCPYCFMAKKLLKDKGVAFEEIDVMMYPARKAEMTERSGGLTTVPQIFIDGVHVGGSNDLQALDQAGRLDPMLGLKQ